MQSGTSMRCITEKKVAKHHVIRIDMVSVLLFILFCCSNDTFLFGTNSNEFMVSLPRYLMLLYCAVSFLLISRINITAERKKQLIAMILMVIVFFAAALMNHENTNRVIIKILCIISGFMLAFQIDFAKFARSFCRVMYFLAFFSIGMSVVGLIAPGIIRALPSIVNTADVRIYTCLFAGIDERMLGGIAVRTNSIFWEPGVYQMYINLALLIEMYVYRLKHKKVFIIELIALFLTYSTTGYIVFVWGCCCYFLFEKSSMRNIRRKATDFILLLLAIGGALILLHFSQFGDVVFGKIINPEASGTAMVRKASVFMNLEIARDNPLHGIGMEKMGDEFLRRSQASDLILGWTSQNTNTLLYQYAAHGIFYGVLFTIGTFLFGRRMSQKKISVFCIFVFFALMYIGENLQYSIFPYFLVFYGYACWGQSQHALNKRTVKNTGSCNT